MVPSSLKYEGWSFVAHEAIREHDPSMHQRYNYSLTGILYYQPEVLKVVLQALYQHHPDRGGPL